MAQICYPCSFSSSRCLILVACLLFSCSSFASSLIVKLGTDSRLFGRFEYAPESSCGPDLWVWHGLSCTLFFMSDTSADSFATLSLHALFEKRRKPFVIDTSCRLWALHSDVRSPAVLIILVDILLIMLVLIFFAQFPAFLKIGSWGFGCLPTSTVWATRWSPTPHASQTQDNLHLSYHVVNIVQTGWLSFGSKLNAHSYLYTGLTSDYKSDSNPTLEYLNWPLSTQAPLLLDLLQIWASCISFLLHTRVSTIIELWECCMHTPPRYDDVVHIKQFFDRFKVGLCLRGWGNRGHHEAT